MDSIESRLAAMKNREDVNQAVYDLINILMDRDWVLKNAWNDLNARLDRIANEQQRLLAFLSNDQENIEYLARRMADV